jgi:hypothetical protein
LPISPTEHGIQISEIGQAAKRLLSRRKSRESGSNVTVEREEHSAKQFSPIVSTEEGIRIDKSEEHSPNV